MAFVGAGGIWHQDTATFVLENEDGDAAGLTTAKAISGGVVHLGPGLEALVLGSWGATVALVLVKNTGYYGISRLRILDGTDPTKALFIDPSGIATATQRTATAPNWSGVLLLPVDFGSGTTQFLRSNGAGTQPTWAAVTITNDLLDGVNHTDTLAGSVVAGDLIYGNLTPKWARLPIGAANRVLESDGAGPFWGIQTLLSSSHPDTLPGVPVRGDLIVANATPAWAKFGIGAANTILLSNGTDPTWATAATVAALLEHNALFHLKPFEVTGNVSMGAGSAVITDALTAGRFANVRIGDRINLDDAHYPSSTFGMVATTSGASDPNNITMDRTNTGGAQTGATATVHPGDHFNSTLMAGLASSGGWGTYDAGTGTIEQRYGPFDHGSYASGGAQSFGYEGLLSTGNLNDGFNIKKRGTAFRVFHYAQALTDKRFFSYPDASGTALLETATQTVSGKTLQGNNEFQMDNVVGNINGSHFADVGDPTKELYFNLTGLTGAGRLIAYKDYSGNAVVASNEGSAGEVLTSNGAGVAPSYQAAGAGSPPAFVSLAKWGTD